MLKIQANNKIFISLVVAAFISMFATMILCHYFVCDLKESEERKVSLISASLKKILDSSEEDDLSLELQIINENTTIPLVVINSNDEVVMHHNTLFRTQDSVSQYLDFSHDAISHGMYKSFTLPDSEEEYYVCFSDSRLLTYISYIPYIIWLLSFSIFLALTFSLVRIHSLEKEKIWVGLSKEAAHQLGTPISSLSAWIELLRNKYPQEELLGELSDDVMYLEAVAGRFSKIGSDVELVRIEANAYFEETIHYLGKRIPPTVSLSYVSVDRCVFLLLNPLLFSWVLENLVKNSVDAMKCKGRIVIKTLIEREKFLVQLSDTGCGIEKQDVKSVFKPGYTTKKRGWGLGLSLSKRIVEKYHGGRIYVLHSAPSEGTVFQIELKIANIFAN